MKRTERLRDGAGLFRQLAAAARNGLPLREVVGILAQDTEGPLAGPAFMARLQAGLDQGRPLSQAMRDLPRAFARPTADWVGLAEREGALAPALELLAGDLERQAHGARSMRLALLWPACLLVGVALLLCASALFVAPAFTDLFDSLGARLPALTAWAFAALGAWWLWMPLLAAALAVAAAHLAGRLPTALAGRVDAALHRIGPVRRVRTAAFMSRLLELLQPPMAAPLRAAALGHLAATTPAPALAAAAARLQAAVAEGSPLSDALAAEPALPRQVSLYARLGEKMNDTQASLAPLRETAGLAHQEALARFERAAIVAIYLAVGAMVGLLVVATYLPIFMLGMLA